MSKVNIVYLRDAGVLYGKGLAYATPGSAGLDLRACFEGEELVIAPGARIGIPSGIAVEPLVSGVAGFVYSRSGLGAVKGLTVAQGVGVIDSDYRGEIKVPLRNMGKKAYEIQPGERVAQLVLLPVCLPPVEEAQALSATQRGEGGFGSTGK